MKLITILTILLIAVSAQAQQIDIDAIIEIESGGDPHAYNKSSGAVGIMQITPIVLEEYQTTNDGFVRIMVKKSDLKCPVFNRIVGEWYIETRIPEMLKAYKIKETKENSLLLRISCYNWGIGNVVKWYRGGANYKDLPQKTRRYYEKYLRLQGM